MLSIEHMLHLFQDFFFYFVMTVWLLAAQMSHFTRIVCVWQWCIILSPYFLGSCVVSKHIWAESPDLTVLLRTECITWIYSRSTVDLFPVIFFLSLLKLTAVEVFMQTATQNIFPHKTVNRGDAADIVYFQLSEYWKCLVKFCADLCWEAVNLLPFFKVKPKKVIIPSW